MAGPCSAVLFSTAGPCSAVLFSTAGPVQRCSSPRRGPVQQCLSPRRALFSGALLHRGPCSAVLFLTAGPCSAVPISTAGPVQRCSSAPRALFSGALLHGGPCSAVLFSTAGPVQRCTSAPRALFSGAYLHGGPCSAVLFCTAGPVQRCSSAPRALFSGALLHGGPCSAVLYSTAGPVQRCSSAPRALFSGAHPAGQGSQTWPGLPAQSPSDRDVSGPFGDGLLASLVSSFPAGMWHVGSTFSALLLPFRSFDGALGPLPPLDGVGGEVAAHCSLGAALSVLARRPLFLRVLLPGGGLDVSLLLIDVSLLAKGGLQNPGTTVTPEAGLVVAAVLLGLFEDGWGSSSGGKRLRHRPLGLAMRRRNPRVYRPLVDLSTMEERHIILRYRLDRATIHELCAQLEPDLMYPIRQPTGIPPLVQVLSVLHFLASGSFQTTEAMSSGMSQPMFSKILSRVLSALMKLMRSYIIFPEESDLPTVKGDFYALGHIPNIIGAIVGTHVALVPPKDDEQVYRNRKNYHSMNVQVVCLFG
ncbi:hypothetical protein NDU88_010108 [Pleurodeles waltl]|uniref:Nuclease HARBI1 n=1 Tax=Pleurodeles waltl TaxID=8319 RepID=A0AAV7QTF8_PLEWA|nr:hypothetical protein NDU88_010108 [Pleurodeles waltl]